MSAKINASDYSPPNVNYWGDRCYKAEAENERLRGVLEQIKVCCIDNAADTVRHDLALKFVGDVAAKSLNR